MKKEKDYRQDQRVIATLEIEDQGQDFIELDVLENGVLLGDSVMFRNGRLSLLGLGTSDGMDYWSFSQLKEDQEVVRNGVLTTSGILVYMKNTGEKDPLPWKATTLKYLVEDIKKPVAVGRFMTKQKK
jgi:hypothetical protein